jgi:general secretion pathway protein E
LNTQKTNRFLETIPPEQLNPDLVRKLPFEFLKEQCAIPIMLEDGRIAIAMAESLNIEAYDAIVSILGQPCCQVICPTSEIEHAISRCYYQNSTPECDTENVDPENEVDLDVSNTSIKTQAEDLLNIDDKAPVVKLVNKIFFHALQNRASDIHIEPYEDEARIRFRVDGVLHNVSKLWLI